MAVAEQLGLDADAVKASTDWTDLEGAGSPAKGMAWGWEVELVFGEGGSEKRLILPKAHVYFTEWSLAGYDLLLGHHDVFERLTFSVLNHTPRREFVLRFPTVR